MKISIDMDIRQNDTTFLKGEELDAEIVAQAEAFEIDGWEVVSVDLRRAGQKPATSREVDDLEACLRMLLVTDLDTLSRLNPKYTTRQLITSCVEETLKALRTRPK